MPAGWERLNAKKSQPNPNIVFIKPLKGPDEKIAQDFLERIAAQCRPILREHHLYVTSLEEFEPNREFVGRNFNAGEVIQLVLKSPATGRWLPFNYVQMVMMHELAHCKQMNHSRAFWAVRDGYASEMQVLWSKGYTGDGLWGKGARLETGEWERNTIRADELLPEHLCGGTFRSRGRKRKTKPTLTYQERKEKRILKKFGKNGVTLGADEETKVKLEKGKKVQAKPRVAGSARGRELRAAAALARFEQQKIEPPITKTEDDDETESGSESEYEDGFGAGADTKDALDVDGSRLVDTDGRGMVKVCEDEDTSDPAARHELDDLRDMFRKSIKRESPEQQQSLGSVSVATPSAAVKQETREDKGQRRSLRVFNDKPDGESSGINVQAKGRITANPTQSPTFNSSRRQPDASPSPSLTNSDTSSPCSICSFANPRLAITCTMCANVLDPSTTPNSWSCTSSACRDTLYRNSGDCGVCGICGSRRAEQLANVS